jgi:hypothetical protein
MESDFSELQAEMAAVTRVAAQVKAALVKSGKGAKALSLDKAELKIYDGLAA